MKVYSDLWPGFCRLPYMCIFISGTHTHHAHTASNLSSQTSIEWDASHFRYNFLFLILDASSSSSSFQCCFGGGGRNAIIAFIHRRMKEDGKNGRDRFECIAKMSKTPWSSMKTRARFVRAFGWLFVMWFPQYIHICSAQTHSERHRGSQIIQFKLWIFPNRHRVERKIGKLLCIQHFYPRASDNQCHRGLINKTPLSR